MRVVISLMLLITSHGLARADPKTFTETLGTVIDARTKKPITKFITVLRPAQSAGATWQSHTFKEHSDPNGEFKIPLKNVWQEGAYVRVMADGYKPAKARIDYAITDRVEIWLKPAETITGRIVDPAGKPVAGAEVALASEFGALRLESGHLKFNGLGPKAGQKIVKTSPDGAFQLAGDEDDGIIVITHESGYGQIKPADPTDKITLKPWARIQGQLLLGTRPGAGWLVSFSGGTPANATFHSVSQWVQLTCDAAGKFDSGPLVPDAGMQASVLVKSGESSAMVLGIVTFVDTQPGQILKLTLGGEGRPVTGRLIGPDGKPLPNRKLWIRPPAPHFGMSGDNDMWKAQNEFFQAVQGVKYHHEIVTDAEGKFHIDHLPQGSFEIDGAWIVNDKQRRFEIKPMNNGKSDDPLDLGDLKETDQPKH
jgi:hypothetical protein